MLLRTSAHGRRLAVAWAIPWALLLLGFGLRLAMGQGGLWLDEAWSVVNARQADPFFGVLAQIHHDNNHPLNSLWIQLVGDDAPVIVLRALSIVCSTLTIPIAARFGARRGRVAGVAAAGLFACSPLLVLIGSEARGYAAALLAQAWIIDRLDPLRERTDERTSEPSLMIAGLAGTLAHLLFFPALVVIGAWQVVARSPDQPLRSRLWQTLERLAPAFATSGVVIAVVVGSAYFAQGGLTLGSASPFSIANWVAGFSEAIALSFGSLWFIFPVLGLLVLPPRPVPADVWLWLIVGLALPLGAVLFRPPNVEFARYYLPCVFALLTLAASRSAARGWGALVIAVMLGVMLWRDADLIRQQRSEPDLPARIVAAEQGRSARVMLGSPRLEAPLRLAAERIGLSIDMSPQCDPGAAYLLGDRLPGEEAAAVVRHCGASWTLADTRPASYRDGAGWSLYRRSGLASPQARR